MHDAFLAIDVGTQSVRAALLGGDGSVIASAAEPMELAVPRAGWAEQNPHDWWAATVRDVRTLMDAHGTTYSVQAIGVGGHMHGTVPLGLDGRLLTNAVQLWCDKRAAAIAEEVAAQHDANQLLTLAGNVPSAAWSGFKMAWMQRYQAELYAAAAQIITPKDYINFCLSNTIATDYSEASGSFLMDARTRQWSPELVELLGLDIAKLPPITSGAHIIGHVTPDAARATGLVAGTPVVCGAGDMLCQLLGMGMVTPGTACDVTGSSSIICFGVERPVADARLMNLHGGGPGWVAFGILDSGGLSLNWWKHTWHEPNYELLTQEAAQVPPGCEGLLFLPYLNGERTLGSAASRGTFFGLHLRHSRAHMTRAIMEGVAFDLRQSLAIVREQGFPVEEIVVGGGGARSALWSQIKADIYGAPIATVMSAEPGLTGALVLAGVGVGAFASEREAVAQLVRPAGRFTPDERCAATYTKLFGLFRSLHDTLQAPFKQAAQLVAELDG